MKFGVAGDIAHAAKAKEAGFDFLELHVQKYLAPQQPYGVFEPGLRSILESPCPVFSANNFLPAHLKITGDNIQREELWQYVQTACERGSQAGIEIIVFGSGASRTVPEGFSRVVAIDQLIEFGSMCADVAARYGITIAVEPLNTRECNILNTVDECGQYVARVAHPNLMLLVDAYHWSVNDNDTESLERYAAFLTHVHVATYSSRLPPGAEPCDFDGFFGALKESGYRGAVTVEAHWDNFDAQALAAVDTLRRYAE